MSGETAYNKAIELGWKTLQGVDIKEIISSGKAVIDDVTGLIKVKLLDKWYVVDLDKKTVAEQGTLISVSTAFIILILHYLSKPMTELSGKLVTFRDIPHGGRVYYPAFKNRAIKIITDRFGPNPDDLLTAGKRLGGYSADLGDISVVMEFFPNVPVTVVAWKGEEEIPDNSSMFFDSSISEQLPVEDISVIGEIVARKLIRSLQE